MGVAEERTQRRLNADRGQLVDPKINEHHGRIVKDTGDGLMTEFASVVDAVRCAADIQRAMIDRNSGMAEDRRIVFRLGTDSCGSAGRSSRGVRACRLSPRRAY
jgi:adenylate cyclase